jgi:glycosyltransferase involved in cell wall biosynthesis
VTTAGGPVRTIAVVNAFSLHVGGVETHLLSLLRHGDASRYRWCVVAPVSSSFAAEATSLGARVVPWRPAHYLDMLALLRLAHILRHHSVDIVHSHDPRAAVLGRMAARLLGLPAIVTVHLPSYAYAHGSGARPRLKRLCYRPVDRILNHRLTRHLIYVSSSVADEALAQGLAPPDRTTVIPNGIDLTPYAASTAKQALRASIGSRPAAKALCSVGRLDVQKGMDVLLEALSRLAPARSDLDLWLAGDGPQRRALEAQARQLGIAGCVRFLGYRGDVAALLQASDVFVLASRYEAMPMTILEAMAAGLPVVVTDVGEAARLVEHGVSGLVVPSEDPPALAAALEQLLDDPEKCRQMGQAAKQSAASYSDVHMVRRTEGVYASVLAENPARR